jgi:hypothetical protein
MCNWFEKHAFKSAEQGFKFKLLLAIFKAEDGHIRCLAPLINLLAQAILLNLKSLAEKHTSVLYNDTKFTGKALYASAIPLAGNFGNCGPMAFSNLFGFTAYRETRATRAARPY